MGSVDASTAAGEPEKAIPAAKPVDEDLMNVPSPPVTGVQTRSSKDLHGEKYHQMLLLDKMMENLEKELSSPHSGLDRGVKC